jgi:hypothetical protein
MFVVGDGAMDYSGYPFFSQRLKSVGLATPWEQYTLYGSVLTATVASFRPLRKGYFLNKYLSESDETLRVIRRGGKPIIYILYNGFTPLLIHFMVYTI